jgi:hypothetical protein
MNENCNLLIFPLAVNSSLCWYRDIWAEYCHKIGNIFMCADSLDLLSLQCVAASHVA